MLVALVALLFCSSTEGYFLNTSLYYGVGDLRPQYEIYNEQGNQNVGKYFFIFNPSASTLQYSVASTLPVVGAVSINGPAYCAWWNQGSSSCVDNTAPVVFALGQGASITVTSGIQVFTGTVTLSTIQALMVGSFVWPPPPSCCPLHPC